MHVTRQFRDAAQHVTLDTNPPSTEVISKDCFGPLAKILDCIKALFIPAQKLHMSKRKKLRHTTVQKPLQKRAELDWV